MDARRFKAAEAPLSMEGSARPRALVSAALLQAALGVVCLASSPAFLAIALMPWLIHRGHGLLGVLGLAAVTAVSLILCVASLAVGTLYLAGSLHLWRGRRAGWVLSASVNALVLALSAVGLALRVYAAIAPLVLSLALLYLLTRPSVRSHCGLS